VSAADKQPPGIQMLFEYEFVDGEPGDKDVWQLAILLRRLRPEWFDPNRRLAGHDDVRQADQFMVLRGRTRPAGTATRLPLYDLFWNGRTGASVEGLTVAAGHWAGDGDEGDRLVPKKDLVGVLQVLLQAERLKVAQGLGYAATLADELQQFRLKTIPLTDDAVEWRERPHDDLVLAVAVAAWHAERYPPLFFISLKTGSVFPPRPRWPFSRR
jgi:hypothetical protein